MRDTVMQVLFEELGNPLEFDSFESVYLETSRVLGMSLLAAGTVRTTTTPLVGTERILSYVEETVPRYSDPLFKAHFRMNRSTFEVSFTINYCILLVVVLLEYY